MIINSFKCESCDMELQPENLGIAVVNGELIRLCGFCGNEIKIEKSLGGKNEKI